MEEWREVDGFPNYEVSDSGYIRNRTTKKVLRACVVGGKLAVSIRRSRVPELVYVHREVARAFITKDIEGVVVKHVNGLLDDCRVTNLKVTPLRSVLTGQAGRRVMILETGQIYENVKECAKAISGTPTCIYSVLNGRSWSHRGYHFKYVE